jgi:glycosyltransferase involved in cell wall biosynthesis
VTVLQLLGSRADGGAEAYFTHLVTALHADGGDQAAVIRPHPRREAALEAAGVPVRTAPFGGPFDLATRPALARAVRELDARIGVQWMNRAGRFIPSALPKRIGRLGGYYDLKYYKGCDRLVANTEDIRAWLISQGWPAERAVYIPNFAEAGTRPALARHTLDTPDGAPLLLGLGRLHPNKAHDVTLKALARLPDAWLWIAGSGPLDAELKAQAKGLGVADRVRWLGWRHDPDALYRAADAVVFPSRVEPLGNVVIQAWAHGVPIIAASSVGPAALIAHEETGLLHAVDDDAGLAAAVIRLLASDGLAQRLVEAGRARLEKDFSKTSVVARWRGLFDELER